MPLRLVVRKLQKNTFSFLKRKVQRSIHFFHGALVTTNFIYSSISLMEGEVSKSPTLGLCKLQVKCCPAMPQEVVAPFAQAVQ